MQNKNQNNQNKQQQTTTTKKKNQPKTQKIVFVYLNSGQSRTNFLFQPQAL